MFPTAPVFSVVSQPFKRSQLGLFQGKTKQYGNNVPFSKHKTRRTWLPNVQRKRLFSETLGEQLRVKLTTRALRTIKKHGGLDNYVEKTSAKILGWEGMRIRLKLREHAEASTSTTTATKTPTTESGSEASSSKVTPVVSAGKALRQKLRARAELKRVAEVQPTGWSARQAREKAMKALGLDSLPSARKTIAYLKQQQNDLVKAARFPNGCHPIETWLALPDLETDLFKDQKDGRIGSTPHGVPPIMAVRYVIDDQSDELRYLCPIMPETVSGSYYNNTWTTIADDSCRIGVGWFQYSFYGTGVQIGTSTSSTDEDFYVKVDSQSWVAQHGRGLYVSPPLQDGPHTVSYAAGQLYFPLFDYIVVTAGPSTPLAERTIIVDDSDSSILYNGGWSTEQPSITLDPTITPFQNTTHWSTAVGDTIKFQFTGTGFSIYGTLSNNSIGATFSATYTIDGVPTPASMSKDTSDGLLMTQFFAADVPDGNHTLLVNITDLSQPMAVGFDFLTYNASFTSIGQMPGYGSPPVTAPSRKTSSAGAIAGAVIGSIVFVGGAILLAFLLRRKRRARTPQDIERIKLRDSGGWSELK
ncbi:putative ribosomal L28 family protein [Lyophyllum shimeji]|uniref:Large ribosomal subunit protein bL28c n=1 Tax=Lyophyllum shimeji TaxID=47721 RepID=A0A9P3UM52_LYOSH|nr:putative ribosomal L28 family protein [Lyophyllum shimeji]